MFWVVIGAIALAEAAIIVTALRMRVSADPARGILGARPVEVVFTLLPVLLLLALALYSYDVHRGDDAGGGASADQTLWRPAAAAQAGIPSARVDVE